MYVDKSTCILIPTRGQPKGSPMVPLQVASAWVSLNRPLNSKWCSYTAIGYEVAEAYNILVAKALEKGFPFILTMEDDNIPPKEGLVQLHKNIGNFDALSGIYYSKYDDGSPVHGLPIQEMTPRKTVGIAPVEWVPFGFTLWKADLFKLFEPPWFRTVDEGEKRMTHDIDFCERARMKGARFAVDTDLWVGHLDIATDTVY